LVLLSEKHLYFVHISGRGNLGGRSDISFVLPLTHTIEIQKFLLRLT
jgi:hypothetical protein